MRNILCKFLHLLEVIILLGDVASSWGKPEWVTKNMYTQAVDQTCIQLEHAATTTTHVWVKPHSNRELAGESLLCMSSLAWCSRMALTYLKQTSPMNISVMINVLSHSLPCHTAIKFMAYRLISCHMCYKYIHLSRHHSWCHSYHCYCLAVALHSRSHGLVEVPLLRTVVVRHIWMCSFVTHGKWSVQANKQACTHMSNAVTLVWGSLSLPQTNRNLCAMLAIMVANMCGWKLQLLSAMSFFFVVER